MVSNDQNQSRNILPSGAREQSSMSEPQRRIVHVDLDVSEIGKNVPENKKSGMIRSRRNTGNETSESWVAEYAAIGLANATAVRIAAGIAKMPHGDGTPPSTAATTRNAVDENTVRIPVQIRKPP